MPAQPENANGDDNNINNTPQHVVNNDAETNNLNELNFDQHWLNKLSQADSWESFEITPNDITVAALGRQGYIIIIILTVLGQKPPGHKPLDKNPLDKKPPCQKPPGQKPPRENILFRNFITFVFRMSFRKEISIWFLAVKYVRHGSIK